MCSFESSDSDAVNHSNNEIHEDDDSPNNGSKSRKGRGYNKPTWGKSGKEKIEFTKDGLCIVPEDARLARYLGNLARNYNLLPLSPMDWRSQQDAVLDRIWKIISDTIDWHSEDIPYLPTIKHSILKRLAKRVRNNRADLKAKYYTPYIGSPSCFMCGDDRVDNEQWRKMVNYWDNDHKNKMKVEKMLRIARSRK